MLKRWRLWSIAIAWMIAVGAVGLVEAQTDRRPNIVFILADDLGWRDIGCYGNDRVETPAIDHLARGGMRFTDAYSNAPNCAPTRACLMTGLYPQRHGIYTVGSSQRGKTENRRLIPVQNKTVLDESFVTLPQILRDHGYVTALVGKWQLDDDPTKHGFDVNIGGMALGSRPRNFSPYNDPALPDGPEGEYLTDRLTHEAIGFIERSKDQPFFLYLSHHAVHTPVQAPEALVEKYRVRREAGANVRPPYAAMTESLDQSVGRVMETLDRFDLADHTIVIFFSDNGGHAAWTTMEPLRGSKGMLYEGGVRVPLIVRWPKHVRSGATSDQPVIGIDFFPTLLDVAGIKDFDRSKLDGESILPVLEGAALDRDAIYFHFPAYLEAYTKEQGLWRQSPASAMRSGDWKLHEFFEDGHIELYNLREDIGETTNLADQLPDKAHELREQLHRWRETTDAPVPTRFNPKYEAPAKSSIEPRAGPPNIIYILADDLGYGDLGCYGQSLIQTPNLDRMAAEGIRFTQHYAGSTVCAPSRCVLMTGLHTGHARVRGNARLPLRPDDVTLAELLQGRGYATALIGKWGLGEAGTTGIPNARGFDYFFGYLNQMHAHNYYPEFLWRNEQRVRIEGNRLAKPTSEGQGNSIAKATYSHDLLATEALTYIRRNRDKPFFLYLALTIPHANNEAGRAGMEVPSLSPYEDHAWPDAQKGHAAMITRMDRDVGRLFTVLRELGIDDNTLVIFSSDNGPHHEGGADPDFFDSNGPLRGIKRDLYEGGIRVPMIARWPGVIQPGTESDHISAFQDVLPTLCEVSDAQTPDQVDGTSFLPTLQGRKGQAEHKYLYWEFYEQGGKQAVRTGRWKGVRLNVKHSPQGPIELYDLDRDIGEARNVAEEQPDIVARIEAIMRQARSESTDWRF